MIRFWLNNKRYEYDGDADTPLLWVIRDDLGFTGTKFSCGAGLCGACTVHIDDEARRSCVVPVEAVADRKITTIEGLSADGSHPVQRAWAEYDVPQCGFCQPGQIMSIAALLKRLPDPTDEQINTQHTNICRCGTYLRIRKAIRRAAELSAREDTDD